MAHTFFCDSSCVSEHEMEVVLLISARRRDPYISSEDSLFLRAVGPRWVRRHAVPRSGRLVREAPARGQAGAKVRVSAQRSWSALGGGRAASPWLHSRWRSSR